MTIRVADFDQLHTALQNHKLYTRDYYRLIIDIQPQIRKLVNLLNQKRVAEILNISQSKLSIVLQAIEPLAYATTQTPTAATEFRYKGLYNDETIVVDAYDLDLSIPTTY